MEAGAKLQVTTSGPVVAILPALTIPTTDDVGLSGSVRGISSFDLSDTARFTAVLGVRATEDGSEVRGETVAIVEGAVSDLLSVYGEFGAYPGEGETPLLLGGGASILMAPGFYIDGFVDFGLTEAAPEVIAGGGLSLRL